MLPLRKAKRSGDTSAKPAWRAERDEVLFTAQAMANLGLVVGTAGNVSRLVASSGDGPIMAITPTSLAYATMTSDDIAVVDFEMEPVMGDRIPSTESLMHVSVYHARPDVGAIVHTHSPYASALAVANLEIPPLIDEGVVHIGGAVQVASYAFPATEALGANAVVALGERNAVLLQNHGVLSVGRSLEEAFHICQLVEQLAHIYVVARTLGRAKTLPVDSVKSEVELFRMRRQAEQ